MKKSFDLLNDKLGTVADWNGDRNSSGEQLMSTKVLKKYSPDGHQEKAADSKGPVHVFLKEMGQVRLLNQEGEIRLAKEIEQGEANLQSALFTLPTTLEYLWTIHELLRREEIPLQQVVTVEDSGEGEEVRTDDHDPNQAILLDQILKRLALVHRFAKALQDWQEVGAHPRSNKQTR